jgi:hypothetical protein
LKNAAPFSDFQCWVPPQGSFENHTVAVVAARHMPSTVSDWWAVLVQSLSFTSTTFKMIPSGKHTKSNGKIHHF